MNFIRKKFGVKVCEVWYEINDGERETHSSIYDYYCLNEKVPVYRGYKLLTSKEMYTLITNLCQTKGEIMSKFEKNTKYKIRRADKEGANAVFHFADDILENLDIIEKFDAEYIKMYQAKGIKIKSVKDRIKIIAQKGSIIITEGKVGSYTCVYHVYIISGKKIRLTYSVSNFREDMEMHEGICIDKNIVGRLNRWLHYEDMMTFKDKGFETYDWGGYDIEENLEGINKFKKGFGGILAKQYAGKTTNNLVIWMGYRLLKGNGGKVNENSADK